MAGYPSILSTNTIQNVIEEKRVLHNLTPPIKVVFIGDSITEGESSLDSFSRIYGISMALGNKICLDSGYNQGVGGDTTADVLSRISTIGNSIQPIVDIQIGTNDVTNNITLETYSKNLQQIITYCFAYGAKFVVVHAIPLKSDLATVTWSNSQKELRNSYNNFIKSLSSPFIKVDLDSPRFIDDPSTMYVDGTHLSIYGSIVFGGKQAVALGSLLSTENSFSGAISDNLVNNPLLLGNLGTVSGVATGVAADNWTVGSNVTGVTVTASKSENIFNDGLPAQTITLSGVSGSTTTVANLRQIVNFPSANTGDKFVIFCKFKVESGHFGISNLECKASDEFESVGENKKTAGISGEAALEGTLITTVKGVGLAGGETSLQAEFTIRPIAGNINAIVHFSSPVVRAIT